METSRSTETSENEIEQHQSIPLEFWRRFQLQDDSSDSEEEVIDISRLMIGHLMMLEAMLMGNYRDTDKDERQTQRIWEIEDSDCDDEEIEQERALNTDKNRLLQQINAHQSQSTSSSATNANKGQEKGGKKRKGKKKKKKKKKNSTTQQHVQQSASKPAEQKESITQNEKVDGQNLNDLIKPCTDDKTKDIQTWQTSDQSNGKPRTIIMAAQCETIRKTKDQINFDLCTQGMTVCIAVYITDKIGNASLTHMDAATSLDFVKREIEWIKNQNATTNFHFQHDLMIHVVENRPEATSDPLGGITPIIQRYLQRYYPNIENLKGKYCYDTSNVDKGNVLFKAKLDKNGAIQHQIFQPLRHHLDEQYMHCIDGIQVSCQNPLRNYYVDKGQNYRDFDFRGATRGLMGFFKPINNLFVHGAKLRADEYQAVVVYEGKWTNQFFELPDDVRSKVKRSKSTAMNKHQHDIVGAMLDHYWCCEEKEKQRALKADKNRLLQRIKAQQNQVKSTQDSVVELKTSNQSTLLPATKADSDGKTRKGKQKANNPSTAQYQSTPTPAGQKENITGIQAKEDDQSKFVAAKKNQDTANINKTATLPATQETSDKVNNKAANSVKNSNNLQGISRKMILITQHEGGIIDINENNVNTISIATGGIVTCIAVIIGYKMMVTGKDNKIHPTISIMLAHVDSLTDFNFIQNRIQEIKRKDHNFNEQNMNIDIIQNPNYSVAVKIQEYLYNRCGNIKNSKGLPCYTMRNSNNGTVLCEGIIKNGQLNYKLFTPNEDDISHQLNHCRGLIPIANKLLKDYYIEFSNNAEIRVCIHQLNPYLLKLEHKRINKTTNLAGYSLDIVYNDGKWIKSSVKLSDWCQKQVEYLENYKDNDGKLRSEILKLYKKCYQHSLFILLPEDLELDVIQCMTALKSYWQTITKTKVMEAFEMKI